MSTIKVPYEPTPVAITTTTEVFTTTTKAPCTGTAYGESVATTPDKAVAIPALTFSSPSGGLAKVTDFAIVSQPTKGVLKDSAGNTVSGTGNKGIDKNGTLIYVPTEASFTSSDSFTARLILSCGQTSVATINIVYVEPEPDCECTPVTTTTI